MKNIKLDKRKLRMIICLITISIIMIFTIFCNISGIKAYLMADTEVSNYFTLQESRPTVADITTENYGQYVDIGTSILSKDIALEDGKYPDADWRVFLKDSNGVWLILADYMPTSTFSVTDVGLSTTTSTNYTKYVVYSSTDRTTLMDGLNGIISGKSNWNGLISGSDLYENGKLRNNNIQVKGAFDLDEWITSWNANSNYSELKSHYYSKDSNGKYTSETGTGTAYAEGYKLSGGYTNSARTTANTNGYISYVNIDSTSGSKDFNDTLYFPHHTYNSFDSTNYCYGYWLASASANYAWHVVGVSCNGYVACCDYRDGNLGVRPAVYLPSDIQLDTSGEVWTIAK